MSCDAPIMTNWYITESQPEIGQTYTLYYDKMVRQSATGPVYVFSSQMGTYLGKRLFSFLKRNPKNKRMEETDPVDLAQFVADRFFVNRTRFI